MTDTAPPAPEAIILLLFLCVALGVLLVFLARM